MKLNKLINKLYKNKTYIINQKNNTNIYQSENIIKTHNGTLLLNLNNTAKDTNILLKTITNIISKRGIVLTYNPNFVSEKQNHIINRWTRGLISNFKPTKTLPYLPDFVIAFPKTENEAQLISKELNKKAIPFCTIGSPNLKNDQAILHIDAQTNINSINLQFLNLIKIARTNGFIKETINLKKKIQSS